MKRIGLLVVLVAVLLLIGVGALVARALESIEQEEAMRHGVVASRVFDEVERELTALIEREEERSFLEYTYLYVPEGQLPGTTGLSLSPLAGDPAEDYVLGHFQIDPDGALQLPWKPRPGEQQLMEANDWSLPELDHRAQDEERVAELVEELQDPMRLEWDRRQQERAAEQVEEPDGAEDAEALLDLPVQDTSRYASKATKERMPQPVQTRVTEAPVPRDEARVGAVSSADAPAELSRDAVETASTQEQAAEPDRAPPEPEEVLRDEERRLGDERERREQAEASRQVEAQQEDEEVAAVTSSRRPQRKDRAAKKKKPSSEMDYLESLNKGGSSRAGRQSRSAPYSQGNTDVFRGDRELETKAEETWADEEDEDADANADAELAEEAPAEEVWDDEARGLDQDDLQRGGGGEYASVQAGADLDTSGAAPAADAMPADGYGDVQGEVAFEPLAGSDGSEPAQVTGGAPVTVTAGEDDDANSDRTVERQTATVSDPVAANGAPEPAAEATPAPTPAPTPEPTPPTADGRNREDQQAQTASVASSSGASTTVGRSPTRASRRRQTPAPKKAEEPPEPEPPVEVTVEPFTGLRVDADHLVLRRDVRLGADHYIQGLVLRLPELVGHVHGEVVGDSDLEPFATLSWDGVADAGGAATGPYRFAHAFEEPFAQLGATLVLDRLPTESGDDPRSWVLWLAILLAVVLLIGFGSLYRAVAVVVHFAERRNNFVAAVSHELKTPLTAIRMYGEILREGMVPTDARKQEYYETITTESERLSRLINNVLELSRLEKGTRSMALEAGSVAPIVEDVTRLLAAHAAEKGFELKAEVDEDLPSVKFDRDALLQVLINLSDNAIKFAHASADKVVVIQCLRDGDGVMLRVRDHGPGVPASQLRRIFQPFFRGERELTRNTKGTGIGLALVQGLVDQMGGRVSARNHPQGGFEVSIALA